MGQLCPFAGKQAGSLAWCREYDLGDWQAVLRHVREVHPDLIKQAPSEPQGAMITDGTFSDRELSWEEIEKRIEDPKFWGEGSA